MRFAAIAVVALGVGAAIAAPRPRAPKPPPRPTPEESPATGSNAAPPTTAKPAGASPVESSDVPDYAPPPPAFAVVPFENRSGVKAFDWYVAGAPFEIAEKTEAVLHLAATGAPLWVGGVAVAPEPSAIAAFGAARTAQWVVTGYVERPSWQLRFDLSIWKLDHGKATLAAEAQRTGDVKQYHQILGETLGEAWTKAAGLRIDADAAGRLQRPLAVDLYAANLLGRGLGHLTGALHGGAPDLKDAEHDLERAVFIDPKCAESQRVLGELYLAQAPGDAKAAAKALGKFNYATDLAPDDLASLRAAAAGSTAAGKHDAALDLWRKVVTRTPWDLEARYQLGAALWATGDAARAEHQLDQVTQHAPDNLPARRVLALIHAARQDTPKLVAELEQIERRAPADLDVKADLAAAYGSLGEWPKATAQLEQIAAAKPADVALAIRVGDSHRKASDLAGALDWYVKAQKLAPESSWPGFAAAQALLDAGKLADATRWYTNLQRYKDDLPAAEEALGAIAYLQGRPDDAAWYLRRATRDGPREILAWRALVAAELARKDAATALASVAPALGAWPRDPQLLYLAGVAHALAGEHDLARASLLAALDAEPRYGEARSALAALDGGGAVPLVFTPAIVRPWGDADAIQQMLSLYASTSAAMATTRAAYQAQFLTILGALGKGPQAIAGVTPPVKTCPLARVAPAWVDGQRELRRYALLGVELEAEARYLARHVDAGATAGLLPEARTRALDSKRTYKLALADIGELRAEWSRGLDPELRTAGCDDRLLAAAAADPAHYHIGADEGSPAIPPTAALRPRPRATFYIDNTECADPVGVWIDGRQLGEVAPHQRTGLVASSGERSICLLGPGAPQCGDTGTVRHVFLHDGWSATVHCPKDTPAPAKTQ